MNTRLKKKRLKMKARFIRQHFHITHAECWNCDDTLAKFLRDLLTKFKKYNNGYPEGKGFTPESWDQKIEEIIKACDDYTKEDKYINNPEQHDKICDKYRDILKELSEIIFDLWW